MESFFTYRRQSTIFFGEQLQLIKMVYKQFRQLVVKTTIYFRSAISLSALIRNIKS